MYICIYELPLVSLTSGFYSKHGEISSFQLLAKG